MFWRILGQLFKASRGRLAVALLALASGAAVTTALINLKLDAGQKVSGEFRTLGANAVILPLPSSNLESLNEPPNESAPRATPKDNASATLLIPESIMVPVNYFSEGNGVVPMPYLYVVASASTGKAEQQLIVAGTLLSDAVEFHPWWKISGQSVKYSDDSRLCLIGTGVARQLNLGTGAPLILRYSTSTEARSVSLTVAGVVTSGGQEDSQIIANLQVVQNLSGQQGHLGSIALFVPGDPDQVADGIKRASEYLHGLAEVRPITQIAQAEASLLPRIRGLIFFMVALILVLTALCVFASMAALAMERRRDVGLMKAIGGSISRIVRIFFTEAATIGLAGALIGYVAGIFLSRWIGERAFHVAISARPEVLPIVVALMVGVSLAGALPLRLLGRVRPAEILRGE
jgi:putative ABC transport system permease protein